MQLLRPAQVQFNEESYDRYLKVLLSSLYVLSVFYWALLDA